MALLLSSSLVIQLFSSVIHHLKPVPFSMLQNQALPGNYSSSLLIHGWDVCSFAHTEYVQWRVLRVIYLTVLVWISYASRKCPDPWPLLKGRVLSFDVFCIVLQNVQTKENSTASKNYLVSIQVADWCRLLTFHHCRWTERSLEESNVLHMWNQQLSRVTIKESYSCDRHLLISISYSN